jgi:hypothetical protein
MKRLQEVELSKINPKSNSTKTENGDGEAKRVIIGGKHPEEVYGKPIKNAIENGSNTNSKSPTLTKYEIKSTPSKEIIVVAPLQPQQPAKQNDVKKETKGQPEEE